MKSKSLFIQRISICTVPVRTSLDIHVTSRELSRVMDGSAIHCCCTDVTTLYDIYGERPLDLYISAYIYEQTTHAVFLYSLIAS